MNYRQLLQSIVAVHERAQTGVAVVVNQFPVLRNWIIGAAMVEFEQNGEDRAQYGQRLLGKLSRDLLTQGLQGCSPDSLERMRQLYREYPQIERAISATPLRKFPRPPEASQ